MIILSEFDSESNKYPKKPQNPIRTPVAKQVS